MGANLRRIEAVTGDGALARIADEEATLRRLGDRLRAAPAELEDKVDHLVTQVKELNDEIATLRGREAKLAAEGPGCSRRPAASPSPHGLPPDEPVSSPRRRLPRLAGVWSRWWGSVPTARRPGSSSR